MDKKKIKALPPEDLKGFEEFIEDQQADRPFLPRGVGGGTKKDFSFEHFTFLTNDGERLTNLKLLLSSKIPFSRKYEQGKKLIEEEMEEIKHMREELFNLQDQPESPYRKSMREIFQTYFGTNKN
jgi:hypothetical protein